MMSLYEVRQMLRRYITFYSKLRSEWSMNIVREGEEYRQQMRYKLLCRVEKFYRYAYNLDEEKMLEYHRKAMELETYDMEDLQDISPDMMFKDICDTHLQVFNFRKHIISSIKQITQNARSQVPQAV